MTDNRVLSRRGARTLSNQEVQKVIGAAGTATSKGTGCFRCTEDFMTDTD
jgi:hypothetical protein